MHEDTCSSSNHGLRDARRLPTSTLFTRTAAARSRLHPSCCAAGASGARHDAAFLSLEPIVPVVKQRGDRVSQWSYCMACPRIWCPNLLAELAFSPVAHSRTECPECLSSTHVLRPLLRAARCVPTLKNTYNACQVASLNPRIYVLAACCDAVMLCATGWPRPTSDHGPRSRQEVAVRVLLRRVSVREGHFPNSMVRRCMYRAEAGRSPEIQTEFHLVCCPPSSGSPTSWVS